MQHWLMKSEPDTFSIDDLMKVKTEPWDGIRNYQARNFMRDKMKKDDLAFFYHSSCKVPAIVGVMVIEKSAYPDVSAEDKISKYYDQKHNAENPIWWRVDVSFVKKLPKPITLRELKSHPQLVGMKLLAKGNRLSIMPVDKSHWDYILRLK